MDTSVGSPHPSKRRHSVRAWAVACLVAPAALLLAAPSFATPDPSAPATADPSAPSTPDPSAPTTPDPSAAPTNYEPPPEPTMLVNVLSPFCDGDAPYLVYDVTVENTESTTATITFINPSGGANVVFSGLPLAGTVLWPGATVDGAGNPTDWPGWAFVDGEWVEDSSDAWLRGPLTISIEVNPTATATVSYPPATPSCSANPPGREDPPPPPSRSEDRLPNTGSEMLRYAGFAGALVVLGGLTVAAVRRRGQHLNQD